MPELPLHEQAQTKGGAAGRPAAFADFYLLLVETEARKGSITIRLPMLREATLADSARFIRQRQASLACLAQSAADGAEAEDHQRPSAGFWYGRRRESDLETVTGKYR